MLLVIYIGFITACLTHFIHYVIGKPGKDFSVYEIFSCYSLWLAKRRLKQLNIYSTYHSQLIQNRSRIAEETPDEEPIKYKIIELENDFRNVIYQAADPYFTWERAIGICPVCTGFWVTLISSLLFTHNFYEIVAIVVFSNIVIRLLNKVI
jgi:type IV secretory pathway VirB6-like protein